MLDLTIKEKCVGCTACESICPKRCIEIKSDAEGFRYPEVCITECIECNACRKVCPVLKDTVMSNGLPVAYASRTRDDTIRMESSSGGIFTELAKKILSQKGAVYGAVYDEQFEIHHRCIESMDDLYKLRGAKYAESCLGNSFGEILDRLNQGQEVLFSGTPCQVAGLKSFLKKDYENLFCIDFVCHGVPSPMAWKEYVKYRAKQDADGEMPIKINLRDKTTGWSNYRYSNLFQYKDGNKHSCLSSDSLYMKLFVEDYISRESCSDCKFKGYNRVSDITLGDFWGIWDIAPEMDDNKGTSLMLIQSKKGRKMFENISDKIESKEMSLEQASQQNPSILKSSPANPKRQQVLDMIQEGRIGELESMFQSTQIEKPSVLRRVLGRVKRLCTQKGK